MVSTIAVGVDGSKTAAEALEMAVEIARRFDASVVLLSALRDSTATSGDLAHDSVEVDWAFNPSSRVQHVLATTQSNLRRRGVDCSTLVDEGEPGDVLVRRRRSAEPTSWWSATRACTAGSSAASRTRLPTTRRVPC